MGKLWRQQRREWRSSSLSKSIEQTDNWVVGGWCWKIIRLACMRCSMWIVHHFITLIKHNASDSISFSFYLLKSSKSKNQFKKILKYTIQTKTILSFNSEEMGYEDLACLSAFLLALLFLELNLPLSSSSSSSNSLKDFWKQQTFVLLLHKNCFEERRDERRGSYLSELRKANSVVSNSSSSNDGHHWYA